MTLAFILFLVLGGAVLGAWCGYGLARDRHAHEISVLKIKHHGELSRMSHRKFHEGIAKSRLLDLEAALDASGLRTHQEN